jgi:hypothetical protein
VIAMEAEISIKIQWWYNMDVVTVRVKKPQAHVLHQDNKNSLKQRVNE